MKKILSLLLAVMMLYSGMTVSRGMTAMAATTGDITDMATLLSQLNIMNGDGSGNLRLNDYVSRAEFAKIAVSSSNYKNSVSTSLYLSPFQDVSYSYWGAGYIKVAAENGICKGYPNATFNPDGQVTYEEALTMMLKVLGYTDSDFAGTYPSGQISLSTSLGLTDGLDKAVGSPLTRQDVVRLIYNTLFTKMKGSTSKLLSIFDCSTVENVTVIATNLQSSTLASNKVATTSGNYYIDSTFDKSNVGKTGDLVIKNSDTVVAFIGKSGMGLQKYIVYSTLDDGVVVYDNGNMKQIKVTSGTTAYDEDNNKSTYSAVSKNLSMGDTIYVAYSSDGTIDYISYGQGSLEGPITATGSGFMSQLSGVDASATIVRNGVKVSQSSVAVNDILYYSKDLDMIFDYANKVTGVYESASPNKDQPTSVVVSGVTYQIEGVTAFSKLSSSGSVEFGDTVTLLLGKDGKIADVVTSNSTQNSTVYGYLYASGQKNFTTNNETFTAYYVDVITPDGKTQEYRTDQNYQVDKNEIVSVTLNKGVGKVNVASSQDSVAGGFDWSKKKLGTTDLDSNLDILDVNATNYLESGYYKKVYGPRLDGISFKKGDILYAGTNSAGKINALILKDVTGDAYSYGVIASASTTDRGASYTVDLGKGTQSNISSSGYSNVNSGDPAQFRVTSAGSITNIKALTQVTSKVTSVSTTSVVAGGDTYQLSDKVLVYLKDYTANFTLIPLSQIENQTSYNLYAYYDKPESQGGRVRVIVATLK